MKNPQNTKNSKKNRKSPKFKKSANRRLPGKENRNTKMPKQGGNVQKIIDRMTMENRTRNHRLRQENLSLKEEMEQQSAQLATITAKLEKISSQSDMKGTCYRQCSPECNICCRNSSFIYAFIPCGHTACNNCTFRLNNKCHQCRKLISSKLRLYQ